MASVVGNKEILTLYKKLQKIHSSLNFKGNLNRELPEQLMILKHVKPNDIVLELGGSIGRASCIINSILLNKSNHVVVEPSQNELKILELNRKHNNFKFQIENSAISHVPLYSKDWHTYHSQIPGSKKVNTITFNQCKDKYKLDFNVLIIDNEGNFTDMLRHFPNILDNIRLISIEHDFNSEKDIEYFSKTLKSKGFYKINVYLKTSLYGPGMDWNDGIKTDKEFISVWTLKP